MKKIMVASRFQYSLVFLIVTLLGISPKFIFAQAPERFSFQGMARKADGKAAGNASVGLRVSIRNESAAGPIVYRETHITQTGSDGVFNIAIGGGTIVSGNFSDIAWKASTQFLQIELDPAGGTDYVDLGATQLLSVPYSLHAKESERWIDGYPVIQKSDEILVGDPNFPKYTLPPVGAGARLIWYPKKGAFRAGLTGNGAWEEPEIGYSSVAFGANTSASGEASTALGTGSIAANTNSLAAGKEVTASGWASTALGSHTIAKANGSFAAGFYNDNRDTPHFALMDPTDRIFQIGHGDEGMRKNAVTILRSGNIGIGNIALSPGYLLDVGGRARIMHNGATAGIHFNNSTNSPAGFVGMVNDHKVGFFMANQWMFEVADNGAISTGNVVNPQGAYSVSLGTATASIGDGSIALGVGTVAKGFGATSIGAYNNILDNNTVGSLAGAKNTDRIFQIGNGLGTQSLSNALTVLRNGNVGIGNNALLPTYILEVGGRPRILHSGITAGIYFDNSQHAVDGFVGMKTDNEVGFYLGNSWKFWVDNAGNGYLNGFIVQTSDRRRKRDFVPLSASLSRIINLKGYHFYWNDKKQDTSLQTGVIAQEVEALFPELVKTDDKGFKAVNYTGLIPHLIESVKELAKENGSLKAENADFRTQNKRVCDRLSELESQLHSLISSTSTAAGK